ncbi:MAG TPA: FMN-binding protein [Candidatus Acidoferrales bacterium]|nr:FMN-binding protein [Candidatus Acidoferrales bacterium]
MYKLTWFLSGAAIISSAAIAAAMHPQWGRSADTVLLFVLLAALLGAGIFAFRSRGAERRSASKNISPTLATLSSAAILAVYAVGYHRTSAVAGGFSEQSNRHKPPVVSESAALASPLPHQAIEPSAQNPQVPAIATQRAKSRQKNRDGKGAHALTGTDLALSGSTPLEYAPAAAYAPQVAGSPSVPISPAPAAPQVVATENNPNIQFSEPAASAVSRPKAIYKDGTYSGWGSCRHGDIQASVTVQDGKIASVAITQCLTRYSCSWIADLPNQVVKRQSPEVDYVSGASQSTDAFYGAVVSALSKAR